MFKANDLVKIGLATTSQGVNATDYPGTFRVLEVEPSGNLVIKDINHGPRLIVLPDEVEMVEAFPDSSDESFARQLVCLMQAQAEWETQTNLAQVARAKYEHQADIVLKLAYDRGTELSVAIDDVYVSADMGDGWDSPAQAANLIKIRPVQIL